MEKNEHKTRVIVEACRTVLELDILEDAPVDVRIQNLIAKVCKVRIELAKV